MRLYQPARPIIVLGSSSGLGLELTNQLLDAGHTVVGVSRSETTKRAGLTSLRADLSTPADLDRVASTIRSNHASFQALVYCAGSLAAHAVEEIEFETLEFLFRVNVYGPMCLESRLLDLVIHNRADIVNVTSSSIDEYYPKLTGYSASKAALAKFTKDLQRSLAGTGARVFDFCPSGFVSNIYRDMKGERIPRDESKQIATNEIVRYLIQTLSLPDRIEVARIQINRKS